MADKRITELDPAAPLTGDELVELVQDTGNGLGNVQVPLTAIVEQLALQGPQGLPGNQGPPGNNGAPGANGDNGWSPAFALVSDDSRRVLQLVAWAGGTGTPPVAGQYVGAIGLVTDIADAVDLTGLPPSGGDTSQFLRADGNWAVPPPADFAEKEALSPSGMDWTTSTLNADSALLVFEDVQSDQFWNLLLKYSTDGTNFEFAGVMFNGLMDHAKLNIIFPVWGLAAGRARLESALLPTDGTSFPNITSVTARFASMNPGARIRKLRLTMTSGTPSGIIRVMTPGGA